MYSTVVSLYLPRPVTEVLYFWNLINLQNCTTNCTGIHVYLYHDVLVDKRYCHSIYSPDTLAQPFIFPYTLGCMVARTTNALAVANGPPTVWETLNHGTSQLYHGFLGCMLCTLRIVICSGVATPGPARVQARATSFWARAIIISSQG